MATTTKPTINKSSARLKQAFYNEYTKQLRDELKLSNTNEVPKLQKIVLNVGLGKSKDDKRAQEVAKITLSKITGQKPIATAAKQSIAGFKLREGNKIGYKVTLRGEQMYEFLDRFINVVLPRMRDFHGVSNKAFDGQGNYSVGVIDQTVFPEITFEDAPITHGLQAIFVIDTKDKMHAKALLEKFGMPFQKEAK